MPANKTKILADYALKRNPWMANLTDRDMQTLYDGKTTITALKEKYSNNNKTTTTVPKEKYSNNNKTTKK